MTTGTALFTFAAVAQPVAGNGWRPFPGLQTSKTPAMKGWNGLNTAEWDNADLIATIAEYQPAHLYCCCLAVQPEIVAIDADILDPVHAACADALANDILGNTPLVRIGLAPKQIRVYRADGLVRARKLHPIEIFCGSGQFIAFGWHEKAGRPYTWPHASPLTINSDSDTIPAVKQAQIERFVTELFKTIPRRLTKQSRPGAVPQTIGERLRMLTVMHNSWKRAATIVLNEAGDGSFNETLWAIVTSAAGRGISESVIWELVEKRFDREATISEIKVLASMIERTRPAPRSSPTMTFMPTGGRRG